MDNNENPFAEDPRVLELRKVREQARLGGGIKRIEVQHSKGKLTARERLDLLIVPGTFNELEPFITHQPDEMGIAHEGVLGETWAFPRLFSSGAAGHRGGRGTASGR